MAKIRKGLSDADMLKGFSEELTFENGMYADEKVKQARIKGAKAPAKKELLLPEEAQERLNRFLLEISMEWLKNKNGDCTWKVLKENGEIVIKPVAVTKKIMESKLFVLPQLKQRVMFHVKHSTALSPTRDILLVAGGRAPQLSWLQQVVAGKALYCADHGVDVCLAAGLVPLELFGDCDSSTEVVYARATALGSKVHSFNPAKDDTDLQLLLQNLPAGDIIATGIWGGRFDHLYSNVFTLLGAKEKRQCQVLLADEQEFMLLLSAGESVELELLQKAKAISLLPLTADVQVDFKGVRWPLTNAKLEQLYPYTISNEQSEKKICCVCSSGAVGLYIYWQENN